MAYFEWTAELSVYNNFLDDQHKRLVSLVNSLHERFENGESAIDLHVAIDEFVAYSRTHFHTEEIMMSATSYGAVDMHAREHAQLLEDIDTIVGQLHRRERELSEGLFNHLRTWVEGHITDHDRKFGNFLIAYIEQNPDAPLAVDGQSQGN